VTEHAVVPSEIEQLPDLVGFLKLAPGQHHAAAGLRPD
jgi:hypothetical protein